MEFNKITTSYLTVRNAEYRAREISSVYNILANANKPMRCKEVAEIFAGTKWSECEWMHNSYLSIVAHALRALSRNNIVRRFEVDGEPVTFTDERYVRDFSDDKPSTIEVDGIVYVRRDRPTNCGHWEEYERTIIPKVAYFEVIR